MIEFLTVFFLITISFAAIAIGVIVKNKPLSGSCGGLANVEDGAPCKICGRTTIGDCETN
ncbi:(Na+)-NQR maturation NqrM [Gammaproteobacteria bacterium]|nr:(Na+)-NQR maturation NqrM [Gammaproteobacteria bacterium]